MSNRWSWIPWLPPPDNHSLNKVLLQEEELFDQLCRLYWLKPADIPCDFEVLSYLTRRVPLSGVILDIGCGDGIVSSLVVGGKLSPSYNRYAALSGKYQKIGPNQTHDLFENAQVGTKLSGQLRRIDIGVDPKDYHIDAARMTGSYNTLLKTTCESMDVAAESVDFAMAMFSLYWMDSLEQAAKNIAMALKEGGELVTIMPSEFNRHMHGANILSDAFKQTDTMMGTRWFAEMEGNRREFINRHSGSPQHWSNFFEQFGLKLVDLQPCMHFQRFFLQDTFQRGLFPYLLACSEAVRSPDERQAFIEKFTKPVARAIKLETDDLREKEVSAYYLLTLRKSG